MRRVTTLPFAGLFLSAMLALAVVLAGCHADEDDPAGQAGELADPVRRANAIRHLTQMYTSALGQNNGDRSASAVKAVADASIEKLVECYLANPQDNRNGEDILRLMSEMRDARSLPALLEALKWRSGVNENHAVLATTTIRYMDVPPDKLGEVIAALGESLGRVNQARPIDNRLRDGMIRTLGATEDPRISPILGPIVTTNSEEQNFLYNRLAAMQLVKVADAETVPVLISALFMFDSSNPQVQMEDVARSGLVRVGRPSLDAMNGLLRGENEAANGLAARFIAAVRERNAAAAETLSVERLVAARATAVLGSLGYREALPTLMTATEGDDEDRKWNAAVAMVQLNLTPADVGPVRERIQAVFNAVPMEMKPRLLAALRHLYHPSVLPFLAEQAGDRETFAAVPSIRIEAAHAYSMLANKAEAEAFAGFMTTELAGDFRAEFEGMVPVLAAAEECDEDISCWIGKLGDSEVEVARKASYMLGRLGRGNDEAIAALIEKFNHAEVQVRFAALGAVDHIAISGAPAAVQKLDELAETEDGRAIWNQFASQAIPTQARLRNRGAGGGE